MESDKLRYEPVGDDTRDFCESIKDSYFPQLNGAEVMYVFDTKGKKSKGKYVCAWIKKMNDEMKFLSKTVVFLKALYLVLVFLLSYLDSLL